MTNQSSKASNDDTKPRDTAAPSPKPGAHGGNSRWQPRRIARSRIGGIEVAIPADDATSSKVKLSIQWDRVLVHEGPEPYSFPCVGGLERLLWTQFLAHANSVLNGGGTIRLSGSKGNPGADGVPDGQDGVFELLDVLGVPVLTLESSGEFFDRRQVQDRALLPSEVFARVHAWIFSNGVVTG